MEQGNIWMNGNSLVIFVILLAILLIMLIMLISYKKQVSKLQEKYDFFLKGKNGNIDQLLTDTLAELDKTKIELRELQQKHSALRNQVKGCIQKVKMERYDAFDAMGGELSYSLLLEDEEHNGVILTSIYGRDESRSYAKLVAKGKCQTALAEEEKKLL